MYRSVAAVAVGLSMALTAASAESDLACAVELRTAIEEEERSENGPAAISLLQRRGAGHIVTSNVSAGPFGAQVVGDPELSAPRPSGAATAPALGLAALATIVSQGGVVESNSSSSAVNEPSGSCQKLTGGTCLLSQCDESRASICDQRSLCVCPEYTCNDGAGRCVLSAAEITHAVRSGALGVKEKVSEIIGTLPGLADRSSGGEGTVAHILDSTSAALDSLIGEGQCKTTVGTCVFSDCPKTVSLTAACTYGVCSCKPNFCYAQIQGKDMCVPDLSKLFGER